MRFVAFVEIYIQLHTFAPLQTQITSKRSVLKISDFGDVVEKDYKIRGNLKLFAKFKNCQLDSLVHRARSRLPRSRFLQEIYAL